MRIWLRCFITVLTGIVAIVSIADASQAVDSSSRNTRPERIVWDYTPIAVDIQVGTERRLEFPEYVEVHLTKRLQHHSTIKILGDGVIYWRVNKAFPRAQIDVVTASGYQYLVNIAGVVEPAPDHPLIILDSRYDTPVFDHTALTEPVMGVPRHGYSEIDVQRAVAHQVLRSVPKRLAVTLPGLSVIPVDKRPYDLYRTRELEAIPLYQVKAPVPNDFYVTAVRFSNRMSYAVDFDPLAINGDFTAASPLAQHLTLAAKGDRHDDLVVLFVSQRSFSEVSP